ncbi:MAG: SDR family NAD(P)-dependent oxidoreductase [Crocinitomicaceae bacterium]
MKNIVIIGASRGIGRSLAHQLSRTNRVLALSRNLTRLQELQGLTLAENLRVAAADLSAPNLKAYLTTLFNQEIGKIDILINNAGLLINKPFSELSREDVEAMYTTNVFGLFEACQAAVPFMKEGGHIVNIGSMGGFQGSSKFPGLSAYSSSKAAVASLTECLAEELKDKNIQANCLALGAAQTEMLEEAFPGYEAPLTADEMAAFIADFSLNANKWINGKVIPVSVSTP